MQVVHSGGDSKPVSYPVEDLFQAWITYVVGGWVVACGEGTKEGSVAKDFCCGQCFCQQTRAKRFKLCSIQEAICVRRVNSAVRIHIDLLFLSFPFLPPSYNAIVTSGLAGFTNQTWAELGSPLLLPPSGLMAVAVYSVSQWS